MKKLPGIVQVIGLVGCILLPMVAVNGLVSGFDYKLFYFLDIPLLIIPALACKLLFDGDQSKLGKFFYNIGNSTYNFSTGRFLKKIEDDFDVKID